MTPLRVSFKDGKKRARGRVVAFLPVGYHGVIAIVEVEGRLARMAIDKLKVLRGR